MRRRLKRIVRYGHVETAAVLVAQWIANWTG